MRIRRAARRAALAESKQAGELTTGAVGIWKPIDFSRAPVAGQHDGSDTGEGAKTFRPVIATVAAEPVAAKCRVGIGNDTNDIIDGATSRRDSGSYASRTRTIASPDTRAEGKGALVGKSKCLLLVDERSDAGGQDENTPRSECETQGVRR